MRAGLLGRVIVALAALATVVATVRLGVWQLDRARQKTELQALIDARSRLPPLAPAELAGDAAAAAAQHQRRVVLQGRWLGAATVYLDNRSQQGQAGFIVVTPLLLVAGDAVLVQRGWVARDPVVRTRLAPLPTPEGPVELPGIVAPPPYQVYALGDAGHGLIRQNLDLAEFSREIRVPLRPLSVQQLDPPGAAPDGLVRRWPPPTADVDKNRGYALQWFALAALASGLYVWFQFIHPRRLARSRPRA